MGHKKREVKKMAVNIEKLYKLQGDTSDIDFSKKLGIGRSQLWRIKTRKNKVGSKFIQGFMKAFPKENIKEYFF